MKISIDQLQSIYATKLLDPKRAYISYNCTQTFHCVYHSVFWVLTMQNSTSYFKNYCYYSSVSDIISGQKKKERKKGC